MIKKAIESRIREPTKKKAEKPRKVLLIPQEPGTNKRLSKMRRIVPKKAIKKVSSMSDFDFLSLAIF